MKKSILIAIAVILIFLVILLIWPQTSIDRGSEVILNYAWGDTQFSQKLEGREARILIGIFDNKRYMPEIPACYISEEISLSFGDKVCGVAIDGCGKGRDFSTGEYFNLSIFEQWYVESVFRKYGATVFDP